MPVVSSTPVSADQSYPTHALRTPACRAETSVTESMISGHRHCAVSQAQRVVAGSESTSTPSRPTTMVGSICIRAGGARRPRMATAASSTIAGAGRRCRTTRLRYSIRTAAHVPAGDVRVQPSV